LGEKKRGAVDRDEITWGRGVPDREESGQGNNLEDPVNFERDLGSQWAIMVAWERNKDFKKKWGEAAMQRQTLLEERKKRYDPVNYTKRGGITEFGSRTATRERSTADNRGAPEGLPTSAR